MARVQNVVIEEIVSSATPDSFEYRQIQDEWVVVLEGAATLDVDGTEVTLAAGEWILIPARTRHRGSPPKPPPVGWRCTYIPRTRSPTIDDE